MGTKVSFTQESIGLICVGTSGWTRASERRRRRRPRWRAGLGVRHRGQEGKKIRPYN